MRLPGETRKRASLGPLVLETEHPEPSPTLPQMGRFGSGGESASRGVSFMNGEISTPATSYGNSLPPAALAASSAPLFSLSCRGKDGGGRPRARWVGIGEGRALRAAGSAYGSVTRHETDTN